MDVTFVSNKLVTTPVGAPEGFMFTSLALFPSADDEADSQLNSWIWSWTVDQTSPDTGGGDAGSVLVNRGIKKQTWPPQQGVRADTD